MDLNGRMDRQEIRVEASTMALYVAVVLLATLALMDGRDLDHQPRVLVVVWGTSIGLALAHIFAFTIASARIERRSPGHRRTLITAQLGGAGAVALLASIPVLLLPQSAELDADRILLAAFIGFSGYHVSRDVGRTRARSLLVGWPCW